MWCYRPCFQAHCSPVWNIARKKKRWNDSQWKKRMGRKNNTFIISAPSGAGKSTLIQLLLSQNANLFFSISHTTRPPRKGELDGNEYYFISEQEFQRMIERGEFLESANVHGYYYGTSRQMLNH